MLMGEYLRQGPPARIEGANESLRLTRECVGHRCGISFRGIRTMKKSFPAIPIFWEEPRSLPTHVYLSTH